MRYARIYLKTAGPGALQHYFESDDLNIQVSDSELVYSHGLVHGRARLEHVLFWETGPVTPAPLYTYTPPLRRSFWSWLF